MADMLNLIGYQGWVVPVLLLLPVAGARVAAARPFVVSDSIPNQLAAAGTRRRYR